jgi:mitotic spindle assembly checkpoint protein MAD2B
MHAKLMSTDRDQVVEVLLEFLEAVLHQLLFVRQVYSPELFERQRLYGVVVRKSRHPDLNQYVHEVVSSLKVISCWAP